MILKNVSPATPVAKPEMPYTMAPALRRLAVRLIVMKAKQLSAAVIESSVAFRVGAVVGHRAFVPESIYALFCGVTSFPSTWP